MVGYASVAAPKGHPFKGSQASCQDPLISLSAETSSGRCQLAAPTRKYGKLKDKEEWLRG